ncbi:DNA primase [Tranquillimonas alkanivorans]|uniref:DNA primase n=1 Tax=Tranquillimonas alkanivorans TaxID=441119 RepID=A0A1I5SLW1_9RHOB|nr:DNA primase [Tranquillimonas alkanivorans]SFP71698.1 DNA primase [Tranquillimonas alkanivorans]
MSLPPGFLDELRNRISLSQVVGRKVMWDQRKSNQGKGDMWAPCPFHHEKTASFHVDDRKGFYYCFGCHAKGDAIGFVKDTENVGFMEAIEILAREAGMPMPAPDPQAQKKADRRTQLADVMEQAVQWYRLQLKTGAAANARAYLAKRGLSEEAQKRWEIGFAPPRGLFQHLTGKGVPADLVIDAGLAARSDRGGEPYDRFRDRILFPIRDPRGRAIALGGRAMSPEARAKYLNSPETELFDKGRSLYNHANARSAAGRGQTLIVAEGYMDVIALAEAGFEATVAPLGTAITPDQLQLMWRIHPEPVIALDGDTAGLRAAMRVIDIALPLLEAGKSLRFCLMPEGQDPDDLIRAGGASAMQAALDEAQPLVSLLWRRETEGRTFDSPERKAALEKTLGDATRKIQDQTLRRHYDDALKQMRWELFRPRRPQRDRKPWTPRGQQAPVAAHAATRSSLLARGTGAIEEELREAVILATLLVHPTLLSRFEGEVERLDLATEDHRAIRAALLRHAAEPPERLRPCVEDMVGPAALEKLFAPRHVAIAPAIRNAGDSDIAGICLAEELAKLTAARGARRELDEALEDWGDVADEGLTWRLGQAAEARNRAQRSETEDRTEYDIGANGARIRREERDALDALLERITYAKGGSEGREGP